MIGKIMVLKMVTIRPYLLTKYIFWRWTYLEIERNSYARFPQKLYEKFGGDALTVKIMMAPAATFVNSGTIFHQLNISASFKDSRYSATFVDGPGSFSGGCI